MANDDDFKWDETGVHGEVNYTTFGCRTFKGDPPTPDRLRPNVVIRREFDERDIVAPDGRKIRMWGLVDPTRSGPIYPSPTICVFARIRSSTRI